MAAPHFGQFIKREDHKFAVFADSGNAIIAARDNPHDGKFCAGADVNDLTALARFGNDILSLGNEALSVARCKKELCVLLCGEQGQYRNIFGDIDHQPYRFTKAASAR